MMRKEEIMSYPVTGKWRANSTRAEFVVTEASDGVALHGALYTPEAERPHDLVLLAYHGSGGCFYAGPCGFLAPGVSTRGYAGLGMNLRDHGRYYDRATFEPCARDIAAAVDLLRERGFRRIVLFGHSLSVTQILYYLAHGPDPAVCGAILSGGHWDLAGDRWQAWLKLRPDNPHAGFEQLASECQDLVDHGRGAEYVTVPWWQPDPAKPTPNDYRSISAQTFLSYYGPDSNCRACKWIGSVQVPVYIVTHSIVDTFASPAMAEKLRAGATAAPFVDFINIEGSGHFYIGYEEQLITVVGDWLDKVRLALTPQAQPA
jgi:pimeloyl-ACP methyl ester carboxylesterase